MTVGGAPRTADQVDLRAVAGRRLMVATPMYEGMCHALYTRSLVELALLCRERGVDLRLNFIVNQPSLNHARAFCAGAFLESGFDHLMMIDADVGFSAREVLKLLAFQANSDDYAVIGAAYSHKRIDWGRVSRAARTSPEIDLSRVASPVTVNLADEGDVLRLDRPQRVNELATGFMMISRGALEHVAAAYPQLTFRANPEMRRAFNLPEKMTAFFDTAIDDAGDYLSEDYAFCRRVRAAGLGVWLCPWIELTHTGNMSFAGSVREIARFAEALQANET